MTLDPHHRPIPTPAPDTSPLRRYTPRPCDYGFDVGMSHVVDHYLHLEVADMARRFRASSHLPPQRIGRYLDGEEDREGLYR